MTLHDFFQICSHNPEIPLFYFIAVPLTALLSGIFSRGEAHLSPWKYLFSATIYLAFVPGLFALTLNLYLFLFERQSIWDANIYLQLLPVLSMLLTFWIIKRFVSLDAIPGFDRLGGLILMILVVLILLWIVDRTRIWVVSYLPFTGFLILLIVLLIAGRLLWKRIFK
ncbi:MAG TPA: hypothetical protein P5275_21710 [Saprospiraceae bacterium]|mgnify:FL=1|nr:hypothetical protein [Saprospiraceae bacterium]MCB9271532.1 hypothetical protein [Lewinellaceae bacterium]HPG08410.1 hypothetical protein [Saprospiraceae bacterium]HPR01438.1 hypothetical protein [Saprospiraceae bacterium]HRV87504.1 hypothetical protein [Saprospiraceae bacterium]